MTTYQPTPEEDQRLGKAASDFVKRLRVTDYNPAGLANFCYYQGRLDELAECKAKIASLQEQADFDRARWQEMNAKYGAAGERIAAKDDALLNIVKACQHIKDNPNVAGILKIAEQALKDLNP